MYNSKMKEFFNVDGEDYEANPQVLTFTPDMTRICFNTSIINDNRYEFNQDFYVNITTIDLQTDICPMSALITILDEEGVCLCVCVCMCVSVCACSV